MRSGIIGITQPRRVAVLSTAKRVAFELGLQLGKEVGYQVRHDRSVGDNCSIKFMTDGIMLQELKSDFMMKHYSVIILDEAHERSLNTDILVGMLSRAVKFRQVLFLKFFFAHFGGGLWHLVPCVIGIKAVATIFGALCNFLKLGSFFCLSIYI